MDFEFTNDGAGGKLGTAGADHLIERAEAVCECESLRIELVNQPEIAVKQAGFAVLLGRERELKVRLYHAEPPGETRARRHRIILCWSVASLLILAGFVLSLLTLEPYRLGLKGVFYCVGIAVVAPFLVERTLDTLASKRLLQVLTVISCVAALASLILLAVIRGDLLAQETRQAAPAAVIDDADQQVPRSPASFYEDTVPLLQLVMALLAFSMELGAGLAMHEARRLGSGAGESYESLQTELEETQAKLAALVREILALRNASAIFVATFWRDFYWAMLKRTLWSAAKKVLVPLALLLLSCPARVHAQQPIHLVIALDLSASEDTRGPDGQTEFTKNVAAVTQLLGRLPAGTDVTIIGITNNGFEQPYFLLRAKLNTDPGYFGEKLTAGRREIARVWKARSERLQPTFKQTDVLGALVLAAQLFEPSPKGRRKVLVIYSDMQQATRDLNLEAPRVIPLEVALTKVESEKLLPDMKDVEVYVLGAHAAGRKVARWEQLRQFWVSYFRKAGANLKSYSALRDPLDLER